MQLFRKFGRKGSKRWVTAKRWHMRRLRTEHSDTPTLRDKTKTKRVHKKTEGRKGQRYRREKRQINQD